MTLPRRNLQQATLCLSVPLLSRKELWQVIKSVKPTPGLNDSYLAKMSLPKSPFQKSSSLPGQGNIELSLLPPGRQVLTDLTYQYPLKLIAPDPHNSAQNKHVTVVFLLTYGGGLVGGDKINLRASLAKHTRLVLVTQGSTKLFKSPTRAIKSGQTLNVNVDAGAALCYLPDPTQPFAESVYEQRQNFFVHPNGDSSLCVLDWVSEGRRARGESWHLWSWQGRNEVRELDPVSGQPGRLLLRDSVMLSDESGLGGGLREKTNEMGVFGSLVLSGPLFQDLGQFFLAEFKAQPRIGARDWSTASESTDAEKVVEARTITEKQDGLLWTAAEIRGLVLVKFCSREVDGGRRWLNSIMKREGTIEREFGQQALLCLR